MNKLRPLDFLIFALILAAAVLLMKNTISQKEGKVVVQANDQKYEYSLDVDGIYTVQGLNGPTTFEIKDKAVHILDSTCPNKTCVLQGYTSPIICLPNQVIITIEDYGEFDAVSE